MSLRKLTAGDGYSYLTRQVAAHDTTEKGVASLADYYEEKGESPGRWLGAGLAGLGIDTGEVVTAEQMESLFGLGHHPNAAAISIERARTGGSAAQIGRAIALGKQYAIHAGATRFAVAVAEAFTAYNLNRGQRWNSPIPPEERARIRTQLATRMFTDEHGRAPLDARELSGFIARASRHATTAVAGFDLTFSPVKSVSTLWALAPRDVADQVRAAHDAAVADTLAWLEREVAYTRGGRGGARQVPVRGLVAAAFTHRDSRAGDPDLHTHLAISNKVQTLDGRWLSLDARVLYAAKVAASEHYNTRLEAELIGRLGVEFTERDDGHSRDAKKRPVREIRGISPTLISSWSQRRRAIEARQSQLAAAFQHQHGRPPTAVEAITLAQQATLETRQAKHEHRSEAAQRAAWRAEALDVLGDPLGNGAEIDAMCARALGRAHRRRPVPRAWIEDAAAATVAAVEESRATWNVWHLTAEAQRQVRAAGIPSARLGSTVDRVVEAALSRCVRLGVADPVHEPAQLRRPDGASVYSVHGAARYTSAAVLGAEQEILAMAGRREAHALSNARVEVALAASATQGLELNDAQAAMVRDLATSAASVELALAPAGTGKTTAMSVLAQAWVDGGGQVIGLAPSAQAAHELSEALPRTSHTDTLAKLTWTLKHEPFEAWPRWVRDLGPATMVIIDEAGQAATTELATAARFITDRGGAVRLIGDDQQLAAVGAGGVLRDLAQTYGARTLSQIRRFADPAEAAVTLAVREGDPAALGFYADNGRIHVGDLAAVTDHAYRAWATDRAAGLDSVLLAPTRELVAQLNARARADRLASPVASTGGDCAREVTLGDGNRASAGDIVITRRNSRRLVISESNWVKNGDRWRVTAVRDDGALKVRHLGLGRTVVLPSDYVAEHVQLGYSTTVHGAQGMTADTAHLVATGEESRQTFYVAISRARSANHIYLTTGSDGDPHSLIDPATLRPPTALDVLTEVLERDGSGVSATSAQREAASCETQLHEAAVRYQDALGFAAEQLLGSTPESGTAVGWERDLEALWPGITAEPAYPALRAHLCLRALAGEDPIAALTDAATDRSLGDAEDRAAVLDWRLSAGHPSRGPLPWLDDIPPRLATHHLWGPYLQARATRITTLAATVRDQTAAWKASTAPSWATQLIPTEPSAGDPAKHAALRADLAIWRAAFAVPDSDRRATGPTQRGSAAEHQVGLERRARAALGTHRADAHLIGSLPESVRTDPGFSRLAERLATLQASQVDAPRLVRSALAPDLPLPDEHAADALWWRIVRHLGPAALQASPSHAHTLRPPWTTHLCARLGEQVGERVVADAMWPALVAAVSARPSEWTAEQLIDAATSGPTNGTRAEDLCAALVWRIATMTDTPIEEPEPDPTPYDEGLDDPSQLVNATMPPSNRAAQAGTTVERIHELNELALQHYTAMYPHSWGPGYVRERLGDDLLRDHRSLLGYAPPGPSGLIAHLTSHGASIEELIDAGLARRTESGHLIDTFRDRLIFPIHANAAPARNIVAFVGRRNPTKDEHEFAGPKYLNTRGTLAFDKSRHLFGLAESARDLADGSTPVLVEGPMDAIAITCSTGGSYVGVAPLGTAFTEAQASLLTPYVTDDPANIVIATDPDAAGRAAAERAFWRLAAVHAAPRLMQLPGGMDPADIARHHGASALASGLATAPDAGAQLAGQLIDRRLAEHDDAFAKVDLAREVARIIGALPPDRWLSRAQELATRLDLPLPTVYEEVFAAGTEWTDDPHACALRSIRAGQRQSPARRTPQQELVREGSGRRNSTGRRTAIEPPRSR